MSAKNIRLWNKQKFDIGVVLSDNPAGVNIGHGKFQMVSEDDLYFISATCDFLQRGLLEVEENKAQVLEDAGVISVAVKDDDIKKCLNGTAKKLGEWMADITDPIVLDKIYDVAMGMDLTAAKLKILREKMPDREFI